MAVSIPLLLLTSLIVFTLVAYAADPLADLHAQSEVTAEIIETRRQELHLDDPVLARYGRWLASAVRGDLGTSFAGRDVGSLLWERMQVTLRMSPSPWCWPSGWALSSASWGPSGSTPGSTMASRS